LTVDFLYSEVFHQPFPCRQYELFSDRNWQFNVVLLIDNKEFELCDCVSLFDVRDRLLVGGCL
jgi:hypothetical protein